MISRELTKYHILRRNRIIDYIRQHFVPGSPNHPEDCEAFCQYLQDVADHLKVATFQDRMADGLNKLIEKIEQKKIKIIEVGPILFMKERYPKRFWFAHRCKVLIHLMLKLQRSIWRNPIPNEIVR